MTPAATKSAKPDIVLLANAKGQVKNVVNTAKSASKKAPARKRKASSSAEDLSAAADELLANADTSTKSAEGTTKKAAKKATTVKSAAKKTTAKKAATTKAKTAAPELTAEEKAKAASAEKEAKAKALASIKIGPKGVYTEDSIRVYLQEIGRIRLLRPDEEIELARKIADLLYRLGYVRKGHLVSVTRDDLVGQYIGHTAPKTKEVLKKVQLTVLVKGSVL